MEYVIVHQGALKGALIREQCVGRNAPVWVFESRERAEKFANEWLADGSWQVVIAGPVYHRTKEL